MLAALAARLLPALAPVLPHMAEDAWQYLPWPQPAASVFQASEQAPATLSPWSACRGEWTAAPGSPALMNISKQTS